jgi:FemAB-related protein (PEP-CTERM system-associated)
VSGTTVSPPIAPSPALEVRACDAGQDGERDAFVRAHPRGTVFHLAGWRRAVLSAFRHAPRDLAAVEGDRIVGVLPLARCRKLPSGADLVSVPYGVYGGPIGESPEIERALVAEAVALGKREKVGRVELRCVRDPGVPGLAASELYATFVRELPATQDEVMTRMPKRARAEVRKAIEKHGLVMEEGTRFVPDLARLFGESKQRLGSPGLPRAWFEALATELGDACACHAAVRAGEVVAATMSFVLGDTVCFYYIGTSAEANRTYNATNFLTTRLQEWGVGKGLRRFDLSRSRVGTGSFSFKENQGFTPTPLAYRYALIGSRGLPALTPSNPRTKILRDAWTRLPGWLARGLSGRLSRYLP